MSGIDVLQNTLSIETNCVSDVLSKINVEHYIAVIVENIVKYMKRSMMITHYMNPK